MEKYPGMIVGQGHEGVPWRVVKQKMPSMVDLRGELGVEGKIFVESLWMMFSTRGWF